MSVTNFFKHSTYFLFLILFSLSCGEYKEDCDMDRNWGKINLADTTKAFLLPYEKKNKVFFKDSLGTENMFNISKEISYIDYLYNIPPHKECSKNVNITAQYENVSISLSSNDLNKTLKINALLGLYSNFRLSSNQFIDVLIKYNRYVMSQQVIEDNKVINSVVFRAKTVTILGKTYKSVITQNDNCYIQREVGILAFRDIGNKLWVFDRFE